MNDDSIILKDFQVDEDTGEIKKEREWSRKKAKTLILSDAFKRLEQEKKATKVKTCASYLLFSEKLDGTKKLKHAFFCKDILCPVCAWRRSIANRGQLFKIIHKMYEYHPDVNFIFLTLTQKNVKASDLKSEIETLNKAFDKMFRRSEIYKNPYLLGHVKVLEITRNLKKRSENYNTYHPHFHVLIAVKPLYFSHNFYLSQERLTTLWQEALKIDYKPIVHVLKVKTTGEQGKLNMGEISEVKAVLETAKYTVKDSEYIYESLDLNNKDQVYEMDTGIETLMKSLKNKNMISYSGIFRLIKHDLGLEDVMSENADLIGYDEKIDTGIRDVLYKFDFRLKVFKEAKSL